MKYAHQGQHLYFAQTLTLFVWSRCCLQTTAETLVLILPVGYTYMDISIICLQSSVHHCLISIVVLHCLSAPLCSSHLTRKNCLHQVMCFPCFIYSYNYLHYLSFHKPLNKTLLLSSSSVFASE